MLYNEFIEGTGCKDNEHNYKVYKDLEIMYMNSDMSKAEIYEYGKKLVDNSRSEKEIALEAEIKAKIAYLKDQLKINREEEKRYMEYYKMDKTDIYWKQQVEWKKELARTIRIEINALKWVIE